MTSYDLEPDYDYMVVEAHVVGQDDWTTLPDTEGNTSQDTGLSCFAGGDGSDWQSLHPFLTHYQTKTGPESCDPTGSSGAWNAATASSGGWVPWSVDLAAYAGQQVELSITVATDPASLGLGVWVDDWALTRSSGTIASGGFEADDDGWTIGPPPEGTLNPENGWSREQESFQEGGVVGTNDSVYAGFAFEDMDAKSRPKFMGAVMRDLGIRSKPHHSSPSKPVASPPKAYAAKFMQRLLKASKKGRVKVRLGCTAPEACKGTVRLRRNGKTLGRKAFSIDAGQTRGLSVKLSRSAKRMLAKKGSLRVRLSVQGADASGGSINASRRIRLAR
jgi:hypothetical protein